VPALEEALRRILEEQTRRRPVLVWYDPAGSLMAVARPAAPKSVSLLVHEGSYLALRAAFEEADPGLNGSWLIYVPQRRQEPSWLRDLELAGARLELGLDDLVSRAFDLPTAPRLRALLGGRPGRLLAARWDELVLQADPRVIDLERAMVAATLELGAGARLQEIAIDYVTRSDAAARLRHLDLHPELRGLLKVEGGLGGLPEGDVPQRRVAAALLLSEAVVRGGLDAQPFGEAMPSPERRSQWCAWAEAWMDQADDQAFRRWSEEVGQLYRIRDHLAGTRIVDVKAFDVVDDILLQHAERLLDEGKRADLREVAERRIGTYWARAAEARGEPLPWKTILAALDLLKEADQAIERIGGRAAWPLEDLLGAYGSDAGWWRLDDAYRRLEAGWSRLPTEIARRLSIPAARAYATFLDLLGAVAAQALEATAEWAAAGWEPQREVTARTLGDASRVAVILADALRLDLGQLLASRLRSKGLEVETFLTLADLPSVTQVGMGAIQSPGWAEREVVIERTAFFPRVAGTTLRGREDRLAQLRTRFPQANAAELDNVQEGRSIPKGSPLIVYAATVDEQGDSLPQVGLDLFERLVRGIADSVEKLLGAGYAKVVVIPDHGFVLVPRGHASSRVEVQGGDRSTARARRYVIGRPPESECMVRIPLGHLGWRGNGAVAFPRGLAVVALPGATPRFFHGGPMPQEVAILTLVCRRPETAAPVAVRLVGPQHIDTTLPRFQLEGEAEELLSQPRRVRVVVRLEGRVISESDAVEIRAGEPAEVALRLQRYGRHIDVVVEDVETREVLSELTLPVELPAGYEDLGL